MIVIASVATRAARSLTRRKRATQFAKHALCIAGLLNEISLIAMTLVDNSDMRIRRFLTEDVCLRTCNSNQFLQILFICSRRKPTVYIYPHYVWEAQARRPALYMANSAHAVTCCLPSPQWKLRCRKMPRNNKKARHSCLKNRKNVMLLLGYIIFGNILLLFMFLFPRSCTSQIAFSLT